MSAANHSDTPTWNDARTEQLKVLWEQNLAASEIARILGVTKNAVVGKAHRLKLSSRPSPIREPNPRSQVNMPKIRRRAIMSATSTEGGCLKQKETGGQTAVEAATGDHLDNEGLGTQQADSLVPGAPTDDGWVDTEIKEEPTSTANKVLAELERSMAPVKKHDFNIKPVPRKSTPQKKGRSRCKSCQWPSGDPGDPDFGYCGADTLPGKPYCAEHCAVAYVVKGRKEEAA